MSDTVERQILETAGRLFLAQGYAQTGINQLIDESGVAKRTFYRYFKSKESLAVACLDREAAQWQRGLARAASERASPRDRFRGIFGFLESFARETEFRGCGMRNVAAGFSDTGHRVRVRLREHKTRERHLLRALIDPRVDDATVDALHVLIEGAIATASVYRDVWPIRSALSAAEKVLSTNWRPPKPRARPKTPLSTGPSR